MRLMSAVRYGAASAFLVGMGVLALGAAAPAAEGQSEFIQDGKAGYVVSNIAFALGPDASESGGCPNGMTQGYLGTAARDADRALFQQRVTAPNGENLCMHPELGQPHPGHRTVVEGANVIAYGIDFDGADSRRNGPRARGTCAHEDFRGANGERGIDNQWYRAVGCSNSYQSGGQSNGFNNSMLVGEWGILFEFSDVDDLRNDPDIGVTLVANADPIALSPDRQPLVGATYAMDQDPAFRGVTRGRIVNGVLTTTPVDVRFHFIINSMRLVRVLRDARLRMTIAADGSMEGFMAGYTPVEAMYDTQYGYRNGLDGAGQLANIRLRQGSAVGTAGVAGHTCEGVYYGLLANADGHPDANGNCTSISTQYRIRAIPAFIVDAPTESVNTDLNDGTARN